MADNTTIVDHILKEEGQGRYSVYFKDLTNEDKESIQDWLKDNIEYNDIQKAPALPDNNKAYNTHIENEEVIRDGIKPFNITAFTGNYDDLTNAPIIPIVNGSRPTIFNEIAFTGNINSNNLKVSNVLDFTQYSANITGITQSENTENNDKFKSIGGSDAYIKGLNQFVKSTDNFTDILSSYLNTFIEDKKPTFFRSNSGIFFITDVNVIWNGPIITCYQVHLVNVTESNYTSIRTLEPNITNVVAEETLNNIELTAKNIMLFFDLDNNIIYCKIQNIGDNEEETQPGITEETDPIFKTSAAYRITNQDIEDWDNASNWSLLSSSNYTTNYIMDLTEITEAIGESDNGTYDFSNVISEEVITNIDSIFSNSFNAFSMNHKNVFLITKNNNIHILLSAIAGNNPDEYHFIFAPFYKTNFNSLSTMSSNEILKQLNIINSNLSEKLVIIYQKNNSIIYWKYVQDEKKYFELTNFASSITGAKNNELYNLGDNDIFISDLNTYLDSDDNTLVESLSEFLENANNLSYLKNNKGLFKIDNIDINYNVNNNYVNYYQISLTSILSSNYDNIKGNYTIGQSTLDALNFTSGKSMVIILDMINDILYCKVK